MATVIGGSFKGGPKTVLDARLEGTFRVRSFPNILMRIHPNCGGLICADGEVVVQSQNGPNGKWLDFVREQQSVVLGLLMS